jgi:PAS domain S-box-containing protein
VFVQARASGLRKSPINSGLGPLATIEQQLSRPQTRIVHDELYQTLFEHAGIAVAVVRQDGLLLTVNRQFELLSGWSRAELENRKYLFDFFQLDDRPSLETCLRRQCEHMHSSSCFSEGQWQTSETDCRHVQINVNAIPKSNEAIVTITDVTELKLLQFQLARSKQLAEIGELSAAIAHEIRNPLGAINTSVEVLRNSLQLSGEDHDLMNIIQEETRRLDRIVKDFLHFARLNRMRVTAVDVNQIIRETLFLYKGTLQNDIQVEIDLCPDLPMLNGDEDHLRQVMINILINSFEAMPHNGVLTVKSTVLRVESLKSFIQVLIQDTGLGIEQKYLSKIFKPFFSTKEKGVGMGLAICERIIHNHGGTIDVTSQVGKGTTFVLTLPVNHAIPVEE